MDFVDEFIRDEKVKIENEFLRLKDSIYLDVAGSMIYGENQIKRITETLAENLFCNPHTSKTTDNIVDSVRFR